VKISAFCGTFPAKLCTADPENNVAFILSPGFFSRPLDYGNLVRIFYVIEITRFIACSQSVLFELFWASEKTSAPTDALICLAFLAIEVRIK
jgi:hypothetical protein